MTCMFRHSFDARMNIDFLTLELFAFITELLINSIRLYKSSHVFAIVIREARITCLLLFKLFHP